MRSNYIYKPTHTITRNHTHTCAYTQYHTADGETDIHKQDKHDHTHLIPAAAAAGVKKGEIGGTGLAVAVDAIGVGGVEPEPSRPDILFRKNCFTADGRSNCHAPTLDPNLVMR